MLLLSQIRNQISIKLQSANEPEVENKLLELRGIINSLPAAVVCKVYTEEDLNHELHLLDEAFTLALKNDLVDPNTLSVYGGRFGTMAIAFDREEPIASPETVHDFHLALTKKADSGVVNSIEFKNFKTPTISFRAGVGHNEPATLRIKFDSIADYLTFYADVMVSKYYDDLHCIWNPIFNDVPQKLFNSSLTLHSNAVVFDNEKHTSFVALTNQQSEAVIRATTVFLLRAERMIARRVASFISN